MINSNERIVKHKLGLLNLAEELGNVSRACKIMGLSRDTFYRYKEAVDDGGVEALLDKNRRKPNFKNRLKALEKIVANDGIILTEAQVQALERKKLDDEECGEIETHHQAISDLRIRSMLALSKVSGALSISVTVRSCLNHYS